MARSKVRHYIAGLGLTPVELTLDSICSIGRSPDCTITINDIQASRYHAELRPEQTTFKLVDLQSRNGTYKNDRRIKETNLRYGDEFRIGSQVFRYVVGAEEDLDALFSAATRTANDQTINVSKHLQQDVDGALMGSVRQIRLPDLIQLLHTMNATGQLEVTSTSEEGHIWIINGQIFDSSLGKIVGEEAILELARWDAGLFRFEPLENVPRRTRTVHRPIAALLLDICRTLDEESRD
jgi:hypothetical protein